MTTTLEDLAVKLNVLLQHEHLKIAAAESCTGGWVAKLLTDIAGSSASFERGFVTYSNEAKIEMLGVSLATLEQFGAVSIETAEEMAKGAINASHADIALAISGIAGPGGGSAEKPVGTVCFAWAFRNNESHTETRHFDGDRDDVRRQSARHALEVAIKLIQAHRY